MNFGGLISIVTGGGSGIGRALSIELARHGSVDVLADIDLEGARAAATEIASAGGKASAASLDVRQAEAVEQLVDETVRAHGRLDLMFNNAGIGCGGEVRDLSLDMWRTVIDINLMGVVYGSVAAYRAMLRQGSGHIVNIASMAGLIASPGLAPYAATKSAVVGLSAAMRAEGRDLGVRVSAVCPGFVQTAIFDHAIGVKYDKGGVLQKLRLPLVPADKAASTILRGVEKNQPLIVFPASARLLWRLSRIHPALLKPFTKKMVQSIREMRQGQ